MKHIEEVLKGKRTDDDRNRKLFAIYREYGTDPICLSVLTNIQRYLPELLAYRGIKQAPGRLILLKDLILILKDGCILFVLFNQLPMHGSG